MANPPAPPGGGNAAPTYQTGTGGAPPPTGPSNAPTTAPDLDPSLAKQQFTIAEQNGAAVFGQTEQMINLLEALEQGKPFSNVDPAVVRQVAQKAQYRGGALSPKVTQRLRLAATILIQDNLKTVGVDTPKPNQTAAEFRQMQVSPAILEKLKAQGYDTTNVNTVDSLTQTLAKQTSVQPSGQLTGADIYQSFQARISAPSGAAQMASLLNAAGMTDGTLTAQEGPALLTAFQKALKQTPGGKDPYTYLSDQASQISRAGISPTQKPDSPYAYVNGLANTIWGPGILNDSEINAIAAEYPNAGASAADDAAIRQAVARAGAQTWNYDPNQLPAGASYLATVQNAVQDTAGQYAMNLSPTQIGDIIKNTLSTGDLSSIYAAGDAARDNAELHMKSLASGLFPAMKSLIGQGFTVQQIMDPYKQMGQNLLGRSANLEDPQWAAILQTPDGKLPSLDQAKAMLMQDPRSDWLHSQDAGIKYANMAQTLVSTWGHTGGGPVPFSSSVPNPTAG